MANEPDVENAKSILFVRTQAGDLSGHDPVR